MKMSSVVQFILFVLLGSFFLVGCSVHGVKHESGNPIDEKKVNQIEEGKTTATDVLGMLGAPTMTSKLGDNEMYIYKNCKTGGSDFSAFGLGQSSTTERCNSLTVTIDNETGIVKCYNYQKMFDAE